MIYLAGLALFALGLGLGYWIAIEKIAMSLNTMSNVMQQHLMMTTKMVGTMLIIREQPITVPKEDINEDDKAQ